VGCRIHLGHNLKVLLKDVRKEARPIVERLSHLFPLALDSGVGGQEVVFELDWIPDPAPFRFPPFVAHVRGEETPLLHWLAARANGQSLPPHKGRVMGFLNGILIHPWGMGTARCVLFPDTDGGNFLTGSAHQLLFASTCLWFAQIRHYVVHAAAVATKQGGYVFWGPSGAGKSTVAGLFPPERVLSDDAPLLFSREGKFFCARTPFKQEVGEMKGEWHLDAPVVKNFFLQKSTEGCIRNRPPITALAEIAALHIHGFSWMSQEIKTQAFDFFHAYCRLVPSLDLQFPFPSDPAAFHDLLAQETSGDAELVTGKRLPLSSLSVVPEM